MSNKMKLIMENWRTNVLLTEAPIDPDTSVADLINIINVMAIKENDVKVKIIKALIKHLSQFVDEASGQVDNELVGNVNTIIQYLSGLVQNIMEAGNDAEKWKEVAEDFYGDMPIEEVGKVVQHPVIKNWLEKQGYWKIVEAFINEVVPMGKWIVRGVKLFRLMRRAKVDYDEIVAAKNPDTALGALVKTIADAPDNSATTSGFFGALNLKDEYEKVVNPKISAAFLAEFMNYLKNIDQSKKLKDLNINERFRAYLIDKFQATVALPGQGDPQLSAPWT